MASGLRRGGVPGSGPAGQGCRPDAAPLHRRGGKVAQQAPTTNMHNIRCFPKRHLYSGGPFAGHARASRPLGSCVSTTLVRNVSSMGKQFLRSQEFTFPTTLRIS